MTSRRDQALDRRILLLLLFLVGASLCWMLGLAFVVAITAERAGFTPMLTLSPPKLAFRPQRVGTRSRPQRLVLENKASAPVSIRAIGAKGDFRLDGGCTDKRLAPRERCTLQVSFRPTAEGERSGTVEVRTTASNRALVAQLVGHGTPARPSPNRDTAIADASVREPDAVVVDAAVADAVAVDAAVADAVVVDAAVVDAAVAADAAVDAAVDAAPPDTPIFR